MKRLASLTSFGLALVLVGLSAAPAVAATNRGTGEALEIAPPLITLKANPGQTLKTEIKLRDVSGGDLVVSEQVNDFVAAGEDGTPKILLKPSQEKDPYSMRTWVSALPTMTLKPQQITTLHVTIHVPANAAPGGHYGVVRFTARPPELHDTGVALSASLGALMLVTVNGPLKENMSIASLSVTDNKGKQGSLFESTPLKFVTRVKNDGNIHEEPTGHIMITDMFGHTVAGVNVNMQQRNVLPASIRKFTSDLDSSVIGNKKLFGYYKASLDMTYGTKTTQHMTSTVSFWVIPYKLIIGVILLLVVGFFVLRTMIRRYNQSIINRAQGGKSRSRKQAPRKRKR